MEDDCLPLADRFGDGRISGNLYFRGEKVWNCSLAEQILNTMPFVNFQIQSSNMCGSVDRIEVMLTEEQDYEFLQHRGICIPAGDGFFFMAKQ